MIYKNKFNQKLKTTYTLPANVIDYSNTKKEETEKLFQFLGFKFKLDDLLIIFFLYSLYTEDVQDNKLFVILLLLLFS